MKTEWGRLSQLGAPISVLRDYPAERVNGTMPVAKLPSKLESQLNREFKFTREFNHESDLLQNWSEGRLFVNPTPPFRQGSTELYINKALKCNAELVVLLVPCDVSTDWFNNVWDISQKIPNKVELRFFRGRIKYEGEGSEETVSRFAHRIQSCLIIIRPRPNSET